MILPAAAETMGNLSEPAMEQQWLLASDQEVNVKPSPSAACGTKTDRR